MGDNYYDDGVGASQVGMAFCILNPPDKLGIEELDLPWCVPDIRGVAGVVDALNGEDPASRRVHRVLTLVL